MGRTVLRQGDGIIGLVFLKGHPTKKKKKMVTPLLRKE